MNKDLISIQVFDLETFINCLNYFFFVEVKYFIMDILNEDLLKNDFENSNDSWIIPFQKFEHIFFYFSKN